MDAEEFFSRWSRRKAQAKQEQEERAAADAGAQSRQDEAGALPPPTLEDVAALTPQSDFTRFIARGVDESVRRSALKKLFSDPHFNVMDGLDIYIDDYNKFTPLPETVLAALNHAKGLLNPQTLLDQPAPGRAEAEPESSTLFEAPDTAPAASAEAGGEDSDDRDDRDDSGPDSPSSPATPTNRHGHGDPIQGL